MDKINEENQEIDINEKGHIKKMKKKRIKTKSEAFPKTIDGQIQKMLSISSIHYKLQSNTKIDIEKIIFKPLEKKNIPEIMDLHKEWFPLEYTESYFQKLFELNSKYFTLGAFYNFQEQLSNQAVIEEYILALIIIEIQDENYINKQLMYSYNYFENLKWHEYVSLRNNYYKLAYIATFGVVDEARKLGLGSILIKKMEERLIFERRDCLGFYLHVIEHNNSAIKFYEKNGFILLNKINNYYRIKEEIYNANVFGKFYDFDKRSRKKGKIEVYFEQMLIFTLKLAVFILTCFWCCYMLRQAKPTSKFISSLTNIDNNYKNNKKLY